MIKPHEGRKRRLGDRYDGFKVRNLEPMTLIIPYIMQKKVDSWVLFEDKIEISKTEEFIRNMRQGDEIPGLTLYHVIFAAMARALVDVPEMNRFAKNCRIYSRNYIKGSMVVMKGTKRDSERTMVLPEFYYDDTLKTVVDRISKLVGEIDKTKKVREDENGNEFDGIQKLLSAMPYFILKWFINLMNFLDNHGLMPKIINKLSPFHSSFMITNMGSIGLDAVYHHIYEFGTLSIFMGVGKKEVVYELDKDGKAHRKVYVKLQTVVDERAADGYLYTLGFKALKGYINHPERLMEPAKDYKFDVIDNR